MNQIRYARVKSTIEFVKRRRELRAFEDMLSDLIATRRYRTGLRFIGDMVADGYLPPLDGQRLKEWVLEVYVAKMDVQTSKLPTMPTMPV